MRAVVSKQTITHISMAMEMLIITQGQAFQFMGIRSAVIVMNVPASPEDKGDDMKDSFYEELECVRILCSSSLLTESRAFSKFTND
jgi:hypothetical protein